MLKKKKNPFAISFIHSPSIHLDAGFIPGTTLGYREAISSIFQNLKKKHGCVEVVEKSRVRKLLPQMETKKKKRKWS